MSAQRTHIINTNNFLNSISGKDRLIAEKFVDKRSCPLCGRDSNDEFIIFSGFRWMYCSSCFLAYVENVLKINFHESQMYSKEIDYLEQIDKHPLEENAVVEQSLESMAYAKKMFPGFRSICDIGCGNGRFLKVAKEMGISVIGIDVNPEAIKATQAKGIPVILLDDIKKNDLANLPGPILFTMRQAIEHMPNIKKAIEWICSLSPVSWALLIETPNLNSWCAKALKYKHRHFYGWAHLQILSPATIKIIAGKFNLTILNISTYGKNLGFRSWIETKFCPWVFDPFSEMALRHQSGSKDNTVNSADYLPSKKKFSLRFFRRAAGNFLRAIDRRAANLNSLKGEYVRALFWKPECD
jgi:2-polyprenyl-3-methyl-5-hydroxy-6-metoxy-1,4-benzoquinol methylase